MDNRYITTKKIEIYYFLNSKNWDNEQLDQIVEWYLNPVKAEVNSTYAAYEVAVDCLGQGSTSRAYILNPNDIESRKIIKQFFPKDNGLYLLDNTICGNIKQKEILKRLLIQFAEGALHSRVYDFTEGRQILECALCFTSIGLCQISPFIVGEELDSFIGKEENMINSKDKFAKAIFYTYKILSDLATYHHAGMLNGDVKANNMWYLKVDDMVKDGSGKPLTDTVRCLDFGSLIFIPRLIDQIKEEIQKHPVYSSIDIAKNLLPLFDSTRENYAEDFIIRRVAASVEFIKKNTDTELIEVFKWIQELDIIAVIKFLYYWVFGTVNSMTEKELLIQLSHTLHVNNQIGFETYHLLYLIKEFFNIIKLKEDDINDNGQILDIAQVNERLEMIRKIIEEKDCNVDNHKNMKEWDRLLEAFHFRTMEEFLGYVKKRLKKFPHPGEIIEMLMYE